MRRIAHEVAWLALSLLVAGKAVALPQETEEQEKTAEAKKSVETQPEQKPRVEASTKDEDRGSSVTLPQNAGELGERFLLDQKQIWTSPAQLRWSDANWLVPLSGIAAGLFVTDADMSRHISHNPATLSHYNTASNVAVASLIGGAGAMWLFSYPKHEQHWRETGFLAGEAALNSLVVVEAMKYPLGRQRPFQGDGTGDFFKGGTSFPSEHATAAWAVAGVVAHEYPGPLTKILVYSLASLVDYSRYRARQHFPSDILVGSILGNMVAENIYNRHHDQELGGAPWEPFGKFLGDSTARSSANMGSPYVPLDSWIYPALDRLAAEGYLRTALLGMRPWTRLECVRLLDEAGDRLSLSGEDDSEATKLFEALTKEFSEDRELVASHENRSARLESAYTRVTGISGTPLTDGFYFGQTITNDYGRPYEEGFNSVVGTSGWLTSGPLVAYARAEYEEAPSAPALPLSAREFMYKQAGTLPSVPPATPYAEANRVQLLDTYVGLTFENWELSYGKQSLWWGPSQGGPLLFSDNAAPVNMFRISRVSPFKLPSVLGWLGPMSFEWLLGQLSGHEFVYQANIGAVGQFGQPLARQPFIQGEKLSFRPTRNFEFSVSAIVVFAGGSTPLTLHYLLRSYSINIAQRPGYNTTPSSGHSGVNFVYKIPGLRNWLTFYGDAFTEDELSPLGYPRKSAFQGGLYMPRIPGIPKLDLRMEGGSTAPVDFPGCNGCFYMSIHYPDGYTNSGNLMGSSLGRGSQGEQVWSTYWFSTRSKIQFSYRHQKVDSPALTGGGTINDGGVQMNFQLRPNISLGGLVQYEKWNYPILAPGQQQDVTTSVGITFAPVGGHL
jgi:membrane-associated phospholipid phosphatase